MNVRRGTCQPWSARTEPVRIRVEFVATAFGVRVLEHRFVTQVRKSGDESHAVQTLGRGTAASLEPSALNVCRAASVRRL